MSQKSKAKAAKRRERLKQDQQAETQRLAKKADQLRSVTAGFGRTTRAKTIEDHYEQAKMPVYVKIKPVRHVGDEADRFTGRAPQAKPILDEDMQRRDEAAHQRTHEIQKRVDIGYNKGGLMLLSESEFQAMKKGELKRRS